MSIGTRAGAAAAVACGVLAMLTAGAGAAYADGGAATPFKGRTEGGSLELVNGDVVACAGVGEVRVVDAQGEHVPGAPGTSFTTAAGTKVLTKSADTVEVTVGGAFAAVTCGPELFPTTTAPVPKGPSLAGGGGGILGVDPVETAAGGALLAAGLAGGALVLRRRHTARA
ncbi:hypothetical protein [Kitasatospora sp. DSM 101779]|uniref:hypothetical protein n=1 Tax=Kitasatospora sp. DSM 101779 TaxID=2853165 RepID=UPI0021D9C096|nr:hypothetical protein [Kitasatospora sp. DSM 101779]MCU7825382.1 hypothetical protein [Kitasatospora sp. DSM 101779]